MITTNRAFADWSEVFPGAACVVSLIDRLMHRAEVVRIKGESYRKKEAEERQAERARLRAAHSRGAKLTSARKPAAAPKVASTPTPEDAP